MWKNRRIRGGRGTDEVDGWVDGDTLTDRGKKERKSPASQLVRQSDKTSQVLHNLVLCGYFCLLILRFEPQCVRTSHILVASISRLKELE